MNVSIELTPELLEYLERKVKSRRYKSRSEVVREAIRMMMKADLERILEEKGLDLEKFEKEREKVSGELIEKKSGEI
ncbi:ribbon-helix-helix domain-containing protein [Archaeoglobus neptunius]|uniref:ribbon-helix-helix domain-containing protein n=1 Tax=Archaeoglobus neptunius TaxID=2798580 RepID=UPI00192825FE|nr:ribbon-helix-helix domain-containing protein [Archaeoglobus neptunius]